MKQITISLTLVTVLLLNSNQLWAEGGTDIVATPGQSAHINKNWPKGVDKVVNDRTRTRGWNSWFSEWPNDVNHYALKIQSNDDLKRLFKNFAAVKGKKQIVLCMLPEPRGLGWVTSLDEGNKIPVMFSMGDQEQINEWFKQVRKPFGKIEFAGVPVAVPPTLTLFVGHDRIKLDELDIPAGTEVRSGYVPRLFHKTNFKRDQKAEKKQPEIQIPLKGPQLEPEQQKIYDEIEAWLKKREAHLNNEADG